MPVNASITRERQERRERKSAAAKALIPEGLYCWRHTGQKTEHRLSSGEVIIVPEIKLCPFHKIRRDKPSQRNGYCRFLKAGDWMPNPHGTMLLWDGCKECGINMGDEELAGEGSD